MTVSLNKDDPLYELKLELINEKQPSMDLWVEEDTLISTIMMEFISFVRYVEFEGDATEL